MSMTAVARSVQAAPRPIARAGALPALQWLLLKPIGRGPTLQQPKQQQRRAAATPRHRRPVRAVAAPLASEVAQGEDYKVELQAAVDAVRLASRLCQASRSTSGAVNAVPANVADSTRYSSFTLWPSFVAVVEDTAAGHSNGGSGHCAPAACQTVRYLTNPSIPHSLACNCRPFRCS